MSPIDLARDSFEDSLVTPSVTKRPAKRPTTSQVVLSKNNGSNEEIFYVAHRKKKKRKTRKTQSLVLPASQSSKVQVIEQVDTQVDLPQTGHFGEDCNNKSDADSEETDIGGRSVNLLDEDEEDSEDS
jgi:hypothetical protein